jgi:hypothetical protein
MNRMRAYVAADFARKEAAREVAELLEEYVGIENGARWNTTQPETKEGGLGGELAATDATEALKVACEDLEDICECGVFVQLTTGEKARGGRHVELGYALGLALADNHRQIVVVGPREHAFHYHPRVAHLVSLDELRAWAIGYAGALR